MSGKTSSKPSPMKTVSKQNHNRMVRAVVVKAKGSEEPVENNLALSLPNATGEVASQGLIDPPYDLESLAKLRESSATLQSFVDAYKTNIAGFGYGLRYTFDITSKEVSDSIKKQAKEEWTKLDLFYKYCNFDQSFPEILQKVIDDKEFLGFGVMEVLFDTAGNPCGFDYIPAHTIKIGERHEEAQTVTIKAGDLDGKTQNITFMKRFRRYRQEVDNTQVWFKEFGDPRDLDREEGEFATDDKPLEEDAKKAGAVIVFSNSVPYTVYGLPRWIGNFLSIQGSRLSEELNYRYFTHGRHTPLAIIVSNGTLTESSMDVLQGYVDKVEGVENAFGYLVLEAMGLENPEDLDSASTSKAEIEVKPLTEALQDDALFQQYRKDNKDELRQAMRLAPIYTGASSDYTRATAEVARMLTEEQVFQPERTIYQDKINRLINQALGIQYVEMFLKAPNTTNPVELANSIQKYSQTGMVIPNHVTKALSDLLGVDIEENDAVWANLPKELTVELIKQGKLDYLGLTTDTGNIDGGEGGAPEGSETNPPEDTPAE